MDKLSCKSPDMVRKEIGVYFLAYTIIRYVMADAARHHQVSPRYISFKGALQLNNEFMPYLAACSSQTKWLRLYNQLLGLIVAKKIGNRPGRCEPRAIRLQPKSYPILRASRKMEQLKLRRKQARKNKRLENEYLAA
ncbi:hypothetical protein [Legionella sp. km772]|uniref:hypothetical protein n=1 Tax=Legionella sp. km772 TaxID=2498111 RepID=UPI000F8CAED8|nr:hypothetical protein [Legionella sp. km772]RUR13884.1 hypothetical protein ELY15_01085 [Legionella sp. km772]